MIQIDMSLPKNCQECRFLFDTLEDSITYYYCFANECQLTKDEVVTRPQCCPLEGVSNNILNEEESETLLDFLYSDEADHPYEFPNLEEQKHSEELKLFSDLIERVMDNSKASEDK